MSSLDPRAAVYVLARSQLDWIPAPLPTLRTGGGFVHGRDERGRQVRWLSCPDCLANGRTLFACETCGGRGEVPDPGRDPYEARNAGFYGDEEQRRRDRARMVDATIVRLKQLARARTDDPEALPEDWLARALRLKVAQWASGDYGLLEQAQDAFSIRYPMRHLAWGMFVVEAQPLSIASAAKLRLDEVADWLATRMLAAIARENARRDETAMLLGVPTRRRPEQILVPAGLAAAAEEAAGKGRWANPHQQGQRNALIAAMVADGKTAGEIARRVGLTKRRVQQLLAEMPIVATGPAA